MLSWPRRNKYDWQIVLWLTEHDQVKIMIMIMYKKNIPNT